MPDTIVKMPQLGESIAEGTIGRWLKQPGERIERDEPLVEVQTDKVNAEVASPVAGVVQRHLQPEGATVAVLTEIAVIGEGQPSSGAPSAAGLPSNSSVGTVQEIAGGVDAPANLSGLAESASSNSATPPPPPPTGRPAAGPAAFSYDDAPGGGPTSSAHALSSESDPAAPPAVAGSPPASASARAEGTAAVQPPAEASDASARRFYTPVVLRMAQEHALDLQRIEGSGLGGRVTRKDVERAIADGSARGIASGPPAAPPPSAPSPTAPAASGARAGGNGEVRALTPMRRAIARHMAQARGTIPDAWSMVEIDATSLVRLRASLLPEWEAREGFELTFLPFMMKAVLAGLREVPELNATWEGESIRLHRSYHLGIAVSIDAGLVVPVLKDADQYSVAGLAKRLRDIVQMARGGRLGVDDLQGATFTVNNPGSLGSIMSQPVVPLGQSGIVTMEAIVKRAVVTPDDAIAVRSMMNSCLSFDHRVLDGAQALRFLRAIRREIESAAFSLY